MRLEVFQMPKTDLNSAKKNPEFSIQKTRDDYSLTFSKPLFIHYLTTVTFIVCIISPLARIAAK